MKSRFYFGALAVMALGLTGCATDEPNPDGGNVSTGDNRYMAVRISAVDDTRALPGASDFEEGQGNENTITADNIRFYFFTAEGQPFVMQLTNVNGEVSHTNMVKPNEITVNTTNGETPTNIEGMLILGKPSGAGYQVATPEKVVVVANLKESTSEGGKTYANFANKSIAEMQNIIIGASSLNSSDSFTMTSSTYLDNSGNVVCYTDVTGNIKTTETAAKASPAHIYVERLASKVRVNGLGTYNVKKRNEDGTLSDAEFLVRNDGGAAETMKLKVTLEGWRLINTASSSYGLKDISGLTSDNPYTDWNDTGRHRCYWANTTPSSTNITNKTFDLSDASLFSLGNFDSSTPSANIAYTYENTHVQPTNGATDRSDLATGIVVRATIKTADNQPINLVRWGTEYFTLTYFKDVVVNAWNNAYPDEEDAVANDVALVKELNEDGSEKNTYKVTVKGNDFSGQFNALTWWKDGVTTYRVNILHHTDGTNSLFGVVRNHIYDYTFNNVIGLGLPGEDPVNPPTPTDSYLAAVVNVLKWHIVSRETVLE